MANLIFSKANVPTLTFSRADTWPRVPDGHEGQITNESQGGVVRVSVLRAPTEYVNLAWNGRTAMPHDDYVALGNFLKHALIQFRSATFTFTDVDGSARTVRYWEGYYRFQRIAPTLWQGILKLRYELV